MSQSNKKAEIMKRIALRKSEYNKKSFMIPTIKEKTNKRQKKFVHTTQTIEVKSDFEKNMRDFLKMVRDLTSEEVNSKINGNPENLWVKSALSLYLNNELKDLRSKSPQTPDSQLLPIALQNWDIQSIAFKKGWILIAYGNEKEAEWGRKDFMEKLQQTLNSETLNTFITDYISNQDLDYKSFLTYWLRSKHGSIAVQHIADKLQKEATEIKDTKLSIEDHKEIQKLTEALRYEEQNLEEMRTKSLQTKEAQQIERETINTISKIRQRINDIYRKDLNQNDIELKEQLQKRLSDLERTLSEVKHNIESANSDELRDKYKKRKNMLEDKIVSILTQINNLKGIFVDKRKLRQSENLTEKEKIGISKYEKEIRKIDISSWPRERLILHAGVIQPRVYHDGSIQETKSLQLMETKQLINNIVDWEYPDVIDRGLSVKKSNISQELKSMRPDSLLQLANDIGIDVNTFFTESKSEDKLSYDSLRKNIINKLTLNRKELLNVLHKLSHQQLMTLAESYNIPNVDVRGKNTLINEIIKKEFRQEQKPEIDITRLNELGRMSIHDLRRIVYSMGLNISDDSKLFEVIVEQENNFDKIITRKKLERYKLVKKISNISGRDPDSYSLWSLKDLKQRLESLVDEDEDYWEELETKRLISKLTQISDIDTRVLKKMTLKELVEKLEEISGADWDNYQPLIEDDLFRKCMNNHYLYPWINGKITGIWLHGPNGKKPDKKYVDRKSYIIVNGMKWYKATSKYFVLQCNDNKIYREQVKDVFTAITQMGQKVSFNVGYTIRKDNIPISELTSITLKMPTKPSEKISTIFKIQDETMFKQELSYLNKEKKKTFDRVYEILKEPVSEKSVQKAITELSSALLAISPKNIDYGGVAVHGKGKDKYTTTQTNTAYNQIVIDTMRHNIGDEHVSSSVQTNEQFFTNVAELLVYLKLPEAKIFNSRIKNQWYLPNILATLSPSEKFPEVFEDPTVSDEYISRVTIMIQNKVKKIVLGFAESLFQSEDPSRSQNTISPYTISMKIETKNRLSACANRKRVLNEPEHEIIYYREDGVLYCFTAKELFSNFTYFDDFENPETGKDFSPDFVKRFGELYNNDSLSGGFLTDYFQKIYKFDMDKQIKKKQEIDRKVKPPLAPDLWSNIFADIGELEDELSNEPPQEGDVIDENRDTELREQQVEDGIRESKDVPIIDVCEYCNTYLSDKNFLKSLIRHGDESRIVKFCTFKCFENKNDWKKVKKQKKIKNVEQKESKTQHDKTSNKKHTPKDDVLKRKKLMLRLLKKNKVDYDRIILPLLSKSEVNIFAKEKGVYIPKETNHKNVVKKLFEHIHPKATKGVLKEKEAEKAMDDLIKNRKKKKSNSVKK